MEQAQTSNTGAIASLLVQKAGGDAEQGNGDASRDPVTPVAGEAEDASSENALDAQAQQGQQENDDGQQSADADAGNEEPVETVSLDDLAEMLDVPSKEIYSVNIPLGGGESAPLGEMKDAFKWKQKFDADDGEYQDHRRKQENEIMVARKQTEELVTMLVGAGRIGPQDLQVLEQTQAARAQRENKSLIAAIPTWSDPATRQADFQALIEFASEYGYSEAEIRNTPDHRALKILYDMSAGRRAKAGGKIPPKKIGGSPQRKATPAKTLAARKAEAKRLGGRVKTNLVTDMLTGKVKL